MANTFSFNYSGAPPAYSSSAMSTSDRINSAAAEYNTILNRLKASDYAPPALAEQDRYVQDLHNEIAQLEGDISKLKANLAKEQKDHEKYQKSTFKRFTYKVGGKRDKFEEKAAKEEREYFEAVQANFEAHRRLENINTQLSDATNVKLSLQGAAEENADAQASLKRLFDSIFAGPTPEFAEEDQRENAVGQAETSFQEKQSTLQAESQVVDILQHASNFYQNALMDMSKALQASEMDMMGIGGSYGDMMERSALGKAHTNVTQADMALQQARRLQPQLQPGPSVQIAQGNLMSDVLFDNVFTDYSFHKKIEESTRQVAVARDWVGRNLHEAQGRRAHADEELSIARAILDSNRAELQKIRQDTFVKVLEGRAHG